jgi:hypothetical protein
MYILAALIPFTLILVYESLYSRLYIDRYYARVSLVAYSMFALALII